MPVKILLLLFASASALAAEPVAPAPASQFSQVDRFPYPLAPFAIPLPEGYADSSEHYIIVEALIDTAGAVASLRALGCEGEKGTLCDRVEAYVRHIRYHPALRGGNPAAAFVVFPARFAPGRERVGRVGPPVVGTWTEEQCAYSGRIYGSAELEPPDRPRALGPVQPAFPPVEGKQGEVGAVRLKVIVDPEGVPCFVVCDWARPLGQGFIEATVKAAWETRFEPGKLDGQPQAVWILMPYVFRR